MDNLDTLKSAIKNEIEKAKEELLNSNDREGIRFFLDSIHEDIEEMIKLGFSYKHQLEIINKSSGKNIKYNTYARYIRTHLSGAKKRRSEKEKKRERTKFKHEAMPNLDELY